MSSFKFYVSENIEYVIVDNQLVHFNEHCHAFDYIITILVQGNALLGKDGAVNQIFAGDMFKVAPYESHTLVSETEISSFSMCIKKNLIYSNDADDYVYQVLNSLSCFLSCYHGFISFQKFADLFYMAAIELFESYHNFKEEMNPYVMIKNKIEIAPENNDDTDDFSQSVFVSKYYFIRKFKEYSGLTPHQFQIQNRIRKSQKMLIAGMSIADTAVFLGFFDQSHFDKYFKKIVGLSPKEYIGSVRNFLQD